MINKQKLICRDFNKNIIGVYDTVQEAADDLAIDAEGIVKAVSSNTFQKVGTKYYLWKRETYKL